MTRHLLLVIAAVLTTGSHAQPAPAKLTNADVQVLTIALRHFVASPDARSYNPDGYLAVQPLTQELSLETTPETSSRFLREIRNQLPLEAFTDFVRRNQQQYSTTELGDSDLPVRIHSFADPITMRHPDISTVITLKAPGYTKDKDRAFVQFAFTSGIHGAYATYILRRAETAWEIAGSELTIVP